MNDDQEQNKKIVFGEIMSLNEICLCALPNIMKIIMICTIRVEKLDYLNFSLLLVLKYCATIIKKKF